MTNNPDTSDAPPGNLHWFFAGQRLLMTIPAIVLMTAFIGFAGFAREVGLPAWQTVLITLIVWALPSKFLLVAAIQSGFGLVATFLTVTLSAARLMPMVGSLVPELRGPKTRTITLLFLSHFVAITAWVVSMERLRNVPREHRTVFFAGFAISLTIACALIVALVYVLAPSLPDIVLATLFFLTPTYFLCSLWGSARERAGHIAMASGLVLAPMIYLILPGYNILLTGIIAGGLAFTYHLVHKRWAS